jgi:hypothetical protein
MSDRKVAAEPDPPAGRYAPGSFGFPGSAFPRARLVVSVELPAHTNCKNYKLRGIVWIESATPTLGVLRQEPHAHRHAAATAAESRSLRPYLSRTAMFLLCSQPQCPANTAISTMPGQYRYLDRQE